MSNPYEPRLLALGGLALLAATPVGGYALQNASSIPIVTWTAPNDGKLHRVLVFGTLDVTVQATGGVISAAPVAPDGQAGFPAVWNAQSGGTGLVYAGLLPAFVVEAGALFEVYQSTAMTAGTAKFWAEIWGS